MFVGVAFAAASAQADSFTWGGARALLGSGAAISCPTATQCSAVSNGATEITFDPTTGAVNAAGISTIDTGGHALTAISCLSSTECVAVDTGGNEITFDPSTGKPITHGTLQLDTGALSSVACLSAGGTPQCTAVDGNGGEVTFNPSTGTINAQGLVQIDSNGGAFSGIACPSGTVCVAVGANGEVSFDPTSGVATPITAVDPGQTLTAVACPSSTQCTAVDAAGEVLTFAPGTTSAASAQSVSTNALVAISCPTSDQCTVVDAGGGEATFSPSSTTLSSSLLVTLPGAAAFKGLDCAAAWICVALDWTGNADAGVVAPVNSAPPSISLAQQQGIQTTETNGTWSGSPTSLKYQWEDCTSPTDTSKCSSISGAQAQSYTPAASDVGSYLRVQEQALNSVMAASGGPTALAGLSVMSAASDQVTPTPASNSAPPTISSASGYYQQGQQLSDVHGTWKSSAPVAYTYQWQDCDPSGTTCSSITGATDQTYTPTASDVGQTLRVLELADNGGSPTPSAVASAVTSVIQPSPPVAPAVAGAPSIGGTAQEGQMLTERHGLWSTTGSTSYSYQWEDCTSAGSTCTAIPGATHQTYMPSGTDVGFTLKVLETADNGGRPVPSPASSSPTAVVLPAAPASMSPPTIAGTVQQGQTLTEGHGVWSGGADTPTSYSYQWEDCSASGAGCVRILGATGPTYTPVTSDIGHALVVLETAVNAGGTTGPIASVPTAAAAPAPAPAILARSKAASRRRIEGANVNATLVTLGLPVTWQFVYGLTTRYTAATPVQSVAAGGPTSVNVSQVLTGLKPLTTYHFRIVESVAATAYAPAVTSTGQDRTFRTNALGFMALTRTRLTVSNGKVLVPLRCRSGANCFARFSIQTKTQIGQGSTSRLGELLCTTAVIGVHAQKTKLAQVRLSRVCLALLGSGGGHLKASFTTRPRTGQLGFIKRVTLTMSKQKSKKKIRRHRGRRTH